MSVKWSPSTTLREDGTWGAVMSRTIDGRRVLGSATCTHNHRHQDTALRCAKRYAADFNAVSERAADELAAAIAQTSVDGYRCTGMSEVTS